jgi:hypothetical protein
VNKLRLRKNKVDKSKFAPRVENIKCEKTGNRPSEYSLWHRSLGPEYFAIDLDYIEFRKERGIVAFIAVSGETINEKHLINSKKYIWARTLIERGILKRLSEKTGIPAFFVIHTKDLKIFHVHNLGEDLSTFKKMEKEEYSKFIKLL